MTTTAFDWHTLTTRTGRANAPTAVRATLTFAAVAALHLIGLALLGIGLATGPAGVLTVGMAAFAYGRGWLHSLDADHIAMIDNSTRKFVGEGSKPTSVGLAFSAGHSTVVIVAGVAVVAGAGWVRRAADPTSTLGHTLGIVGGSVSTLYLLAVAAANLPQLLNAIVAVRHPHDGQLPARVGGPASRALSAPLARVTHPGHIYFFGVAFGVGFDTASTLAMLMLTGAATVAGAPPVALMALPVLFAAGMTCGDTINQMVMLRMYTAAVSATTRARFNVAVTAVSIGAALLIATITAAGLLTDSFGLQTAPLTALSEVNTDWYGIALVGVFLLIGAGVVLRWSLQRRHNAAVQ